MQRGEHRRGAADVIGVRMRQHEQRHGAPAMREVRHDGRAPASPPSQLRPASMRIHRPARVRIASASPCPTSIMWSSVNAAAQAARAARPRGARSHSRRRARGAPDARRAGDERRERGDAGQQRGRSPWAATAGAACGTAAPTRATASNAAISACAASAHSRSTGPIGMQSARKSTGCSNPITGSASRFVAGPTSEIRPNVHATSGAVTTVATMLTTAPDASLRRTPRHVGGNDASRERAARDQRRRAGDAELPAEIEHDARIDERHDAAEREDRPGRRGALAQPARDAARRASPPRAPPVAARRSPTTYATSSTSVRDARRHDAAGAASRRAAAARAR